MICSNCGQRVDEYPCPHCGFAAAKHGEARRQRADEAVQRARSRARWQRHYQALNALFRVDVGEFIGFLRMSAKWLLLGSLVGVLAGSASAIFLISLDWATRIRLENSALLLLLPAAGFAVGYVYWRYGGKASLGNNLVIDEVNHNRSRIPLRMAPFVLAGTVITHFFGGSAGREGTAIQMGASLADTLRRVLRLNPVDRRLMIMAGISGGFGSVFGVPVAGFVFGMEVQNIGRIRYEGIIPCLVASIVGDLVTRAWGAPHSHYPHMAETPIAPLLLAQVALAGIAFGLTSILFIELTHGIKHLNQRLLRWPPLYPVAGGLAIIGLTLLLGTNDYLGLSLPLIRDSVEDVGVVPLAFLFKLIFTAVTLGSGYLGGEVTPLFVIGSTLGFTLGGVLGVDPAFLASIGMVAVFAGASNTPLACALMGIELFGGGAALYLFVGTVLAYLASGHRGIYTTQIISVPKPARSSDSDGENLQAVAARAGGWLPALPIMGESLAQRSVRVLMTQPAIAVQASTPIPELVRLALHEGVRALPVLDTQRCVVGIITDHDLKRAGLPSLTLLRHMDADNLAAALAHGADRDASTIMSSPAVTLKHHSRLRDAAARMNQRSLKRLPIVDARGHLLGILTRSDILREFAMQAEMQGGAEGSEFDWLARVEDAELEPAYSIDGEARLGAVLRLMREQSVWRVIVLHNGQPAGIITGSDLLSRVPNGLREVTTAALQSGGEVPAEDFGPSAAELMTTPLLSIQPTMPIHQALRAMIDARIKRLPVVNSDGEVIGLVSRAGLMRGLLNARHRE